MMPGHTRRTHVLSPAELRERAAAGRISVQKRKGHVLTPAEIQERQKAGAASARKRG